MADTHTNVLVRMPNELKGAIQREAVVHGRSITSEINTRLRDSLKPQAPGIAPAPSHPTAPHAAQTNSNSAMGNTAVTVNSTAHEPAPYGASAAPAQPLHAIEQSMLAIFRNMPPDKQLALLSLFR